METAASIRLRSKALPGLTTDVACDSSPINDRSSCFFQSFEELDDLSASSTGQLLSAGYQVSLAVAEFAFATSRFQFQER